MTETARKFLEMIWDEGHHAGDTSQAMAGINDLWPDPKQAIHALAEAYIEALMDLGPAAAASILVLEQILENEAEDEDLRNFAWLALKSVGTGARDHPCGGTMAEHMRTLYRVEWSSDQRPPE